MEHSGPVGLVASRQIGLIVYKNDIGKWRELVSGKESIFRKYLMEFGDGDNNQTELTETPIEPPDAANLQTEIKEDKETKVSQCN